MSTFASSVGVKNQHRHQPSKKLDEVPANPRPTLEEEGKGVQSLNDAHALVESLARRNLMTPEAARAVSAAFSSLLRSSMKMPSIEVDKAVKTGVSMIIDKPSPSIAMVDVPPVRSESAGSTSQNSKGELSDASQHESGDTSNMPKSRRPFKPPSSKRQQLTAEEAAEVYALRPKAGRGGSLKRGCMAHCKEVAPRFGVTPKTIRDIWHGRTWVSATKHLWTEEEKHRRDQGIISDDDDDQSESLSPRSKQIQLAQQAQQAQGQWDPLFTGVAGDPSALYQNPQLLASAQVHVAAQQQLKQLEQLEQLNYLQGIKTAMESQALLQNYKNAQAALQEDTLRSQLATRQQPQGGAHHVPGLQGNMQSQMQLLQSMQGAGIQNRDLSGALGLSPSAASGVRTPQAILPGILSEGIPNLGGLHDVLPQGSQGMLSTGALRNLGPGQLPHGARPGQQ